MGFSQDKFHLLQIQNCTFQTGVPYLPNSPQSQGYDILYVAKGRLGFFVETGQFLVGEGELLCIPLEQQRKISYVQKEPAQWYWIRFTTEENEAALELPCQTLCPGDSLEELMEILLSCWKQREKGYQLKTQGLLLLLLQQIKASPAQQTSTSIDPRIARAVDYMEEHYNHAITAETLAELAELHPAYFGALFKEEMGQSFRQYLTAVRLRHGERLLRQGQHTVTEVSLLCGFSDVFYFSRLFKEHKGIAPSQLFSYLTDPSVLADG